MTTSSKISDLPPLLAPTGKEVSPVAINGGNSKVTLQAIANLATAETVGLDKVDNTPDAEKPISKDQQAALDNLSGKINVQITKAEW